MKNHQLIEVSIMGGLVGIVLIAIAVKIVFGIIKFLKSSQQDKIKNSNRESLGRAEDNDVFIIIKVKLAHSVKSVHQRTQADMSPLPPSP